MDSSLVLTVVQTFLQVLDSPISGEIQSAWGYKSQLEKLKHTISTIEAVLLNVESQQRLQLPCSIPPVTLKRLKEAVYEAEDLFDEIATITQRKKLLGKQLSEEVRLFFSRFNQLYYAFSKSREIKNIRQQLDEIAKDHHDFGSMQVPLVTPGVRNNPRETHSFVCEEDVIIGRDEDKRIVIDMLCDSTASEKEVSVVSIVGIGGFGKTTLAQLVYNDATIQREFQLKMWVCVSDDFNVKSLLCKIIEEAKHKPIESGLSMEQLQKNIRQELEGKKYLLVLDDIWNEDSNKWLNLRSILSQCGSGSRIVVTTRSMKVASTVGSYQTHELKGLSDQDSWSLFKKMTLERGQTQMEEHLVDIGKAIVRKCANVPLAIRVIGSLLRGMGESTWRNVMNKDLAKIEQHENNGGIIPVLKISYNHLPSYLKSCFAFCAVFPKDHEIIKVDLIYLWMAQGFLTPLNGQKLEDVGEEYFTDLLQRCFFQDVQRDVKTGKITSCKMHDLVHDLAQGLGGTEIKFSNNDMCSMNDKTYHIFIDDTIFEILHLDGFLTKMKKLRTWIAPRTQFKCFEGLLPQMRYLRVLDLRGNYNAERSSLVKLPNMIGEFPHLRYLDLSYNYELLEIPNSIGQLINLQTLKLFNCRMLKELPRDLSKLVNLRHLDITNCDDLQYMPPGMNKMSCLHKLPMFVLGGVGKIADVKDLNNLTESLVIVMKEGWTYNNEIAMEGEKYLINKPLLKDITIIFECGIIPDAIAEALVESLQPHPNIKEFSMYHYPGGEFPSWGDMDSLKDLNTLLSNLVQIDLCNCTRLKHVPSLSQLRHLKSLSLHSLNELEYVEEGAPIGGTLDSRVVVFFPALERLELRVLPKLKGWWRAASPSLSTSHSESVVESDIQILGFPCLSNLQITNCPDLTSFPSLPKLELLCVGNCSKALRCFHSLPTESFQHLTKLVISYDKEIESLETVELFRSGCMSFIRSFQLIVCSKLKSISGREVWENFTALEQLTLSGLQELEMEDNNEMPWRCLAPSLHSLTLWKLPKMGKLPTGIQHLTALTYLQIQSCRNLEEIPAWISCLASLQRLEIYECQRVKSLPEEMQHLTCLNTLKLLICSPELKERCQEQTGADWHKIKHIPTIHII